MPKTIDVNVVNPFLSAVLDVLSTMAHMTPLPGKPFMKTSRLAKGDITGIIGITGSATGTISITFTEPCALKVVSNMLGEEVTEVEVLRDGIGEVTNMVSGQARQGLAGVGLKFHASIPMVIMGRNHVIKHHAEGPVLAIPFETPEGEIIVEVCFGKIGH